MSYTSIGIFNSVKDWFSGASSPESLMSRFVKKGDSRALSALFYQHNNALYYYLLVMSDADLAADIAQKTWLKVIEQKHMYNNTGKFEAWLFTMARNALLDELRRKSRFEHDHDAVDALAIDDTEDATNDDFHNALKRLPMEQKEAFSLQQEGFSLAEISHICHVPQETIKTRLRYAKEKLKKALEEKQ